MSALIRRLCLMLLAVSLGFAAGCAAPEPAATARDAAGTTAASRPATGAAAPAPAPARASPAPSAPSAGAPSLSAPPMSDPLPPERVPDAPAGAGASQVDRSCRSDADCTVKDVGSCCGYQPACVNTKSRPDPQAVQAQCAKSGMSSICGFQEISGCQCVKGQCQAGGGAVR